MFTGWSGYYLHQHQNLNAKERRLIDGESVKENTSEYIRKTSEFLDNRSRAKGQCGRLRQQKPGGQTRGVLKASWL